VPSGDFGGQEPGDGDQIRHTARRQYGVPFPLAAKVTVRGPGSHPFYRWAAVERPLGPPAGVSTSIWSGGDAAWPPPLRQPSNPPIRGWLRRWRGNSPTRPRSGGSRRSRRRFIRETTDSKRKIPPI
jgi:hypothetical protein